LACVEKEKGMTMERTEQNTLLSAPDKVLEGSYPDWPAIFGGGVVAVAIASVFTGFGAALGLSTLSANPGEGSFNLMLILSAIWIMATLVTSYMAGGYIAGRMRRRVASVSADEVTARDGLNGQPLWHSTRSFALKPATCEDTTWATVPPSITPPTATGAA